MVGGEWRRAGKSQGEAEEGKAEFVGGGTELGKREVESQLK